MDSAFLNVQPGTSVRAKFDFVSTDDSSLSFKKGDVLLLFTVLGSGWADGLNEAGERGWFPSNYVEILSNAPPAKQQSKWVRLTSEDGNIIYWYNTVTGETSSNLPSSEHDDPIVTGADSSSRDSGYQSRSSKDNWGSKTRNSSAEKLPPNWRVKQTPDGRTYYYNIIGDQTAWTLENVNPENGEMMVSFLSTDRRTSHESNSYIESLNTEHAMSSWSKLTEDVVVAIQNLNYSAKSNNKVKFMQQTSSIVESIRAILHASGTARKGRGPIASLNHHHRQIMTTLSKLVLAAKTASEVWPPPDAAAKIQEATNDVLIATRHFVTAAHEAGVEIKLSGHGPSEESFQAGGAISSSSNVLNSNSTTPVPPIPPPRRSTSSATRPLHNSASQNDPSNIELPTNHIQLIASSEQYTRSIFRMIANLSQTIKSSKCNSQQLISQVRSIVTEVGKFLSLVDELPVELLQDESATEFKVAKLSLYNTISGLVMATQTATSPLAPTHAIEQSLLSTSLVEKAVKDLLVATKVMVEEKEYIEREKIAHFIEEQNRASAPHIPHRSETTVQLDAAENTLGRAESRREVSMPLLSSNNSQQQRLMNSTPRRSSEGTISLHTPPVTPPTLSLATNHMPSNQGELSARSSTDRLKNFLHPAPLAAGSHVASVNSETSSINSTSSSIYKNWFMAYDYGSQNIVMTADGKVKGATLECLVERLTLHDALDTSYYQSFMLTYRAFITTTDLFDLLFRRFVIQPPQGLNEEEMILWTEKKQTPIRLRVFNVLKQWVEAHCLDNEEDQTNLLRLKNFCTDIIQPALPKPADQLHNLIEKRKTGGIRKIVSGGLPTIPAPSAIFQKGIKRIRFLEVDPLELARQLTLMEVRDFIKIQPVEFIKKAWSDKQNPVSVNIRNMISQSNKITGWVASTILSEHDIKRRSSMLKHFIMISERCRALNNFNTLMSILAGIQSAPVHRLKRTWDMLPVKANHSLDTLRKLMNPAKNFSIYRDSLRGVTPPCVPFLGVYLTDLTFIEDGNPDYLKTTSSISSSSQPNSPPSPNAMRLVNFAKNSKTAEIIKEIQRFQHVVYNLITVPELQDFLGQCLHEANYTDEQTLYNTSLQLEPKEREDEKMARLLQESGFL